MKQLEQKLVELIDKAEGAGKEAFLFSKEQIPDVIHQLLMWKLWNSMFYVTVTAFGIIFSILFARWIYIQSRDNGMDSDTSFVFFCFICLPAFLTSTIFFISHASTALQIYIAPKVYLIEYAKELLK
jgi:hypothetical protein